jgi:hypothetical protein
MVVVGGSARWKARWSPHSIGLFISSAGLNRSLPTSWFSSARRLGREVGGLTLQLDGGGQHAVPAHAVGAADPPGWPRYRQ